MLSRNCKWIINIHASITRNFLIESSEWNFRIWEVKMSEVPSTNSKWGTLFIYSIAKVLVASSVIFQNTSFLSNKIELLKNTQFQKFLQKCFFSIIQFIFLLLISQKLDTGVLILKIANKKGPEVHSPGSNKYRIQMVLRNWSTVTRSARIQVIAKNEVKSPYWMHDRCTILDRGSQTYW